MTVPISIRVGDTVDFDFSASDYLAPTWALTLVIVDQNNSYSFDSTDNADGSHNFARTPAQTAAWNPGEYRYYITASDGTDRHTVESGYIALLRDPAMGPMDDRSHVKKVLDALEAVIEDKATSDQLSIEIAGRSISKMTPEQILTWHSTYTAMYRKEVRDAEAANGVGRSSKIKVRFK